LFLDYKFIDPASLSKVFYN
jgi:hypothetical protein